MGSDLLDGCIVVARFLGFGVVAEEVVEEDEEDDEGAHAGAVEVQLVLHYFIILRIYVYLSSFHF